ncbi:MAG TPA: hypothetical protein VK540_26930 [Polyangiaceae bacterium]|nr:hypothetical protein [Polyangiaceae bacterium]
MKTLALLALLAVDFSQTCPADRVEESRSGARPRKSIMSDAPPSALQARSAPIRNKTDTSAVHDSATPRRHRLRCTSWRGGVDTGAELG